MKVANHQSGGSTVRNDVYEVVVVSSGGATTRTDFAVGNINGSYPQMLTTDRLVFVGNEPEIFELIRTGLYSTGHTFQIGRSGTTTVSSVLSQDFTGFGFNQVSNNYVNGELVSSARGQWYDNFLRIPDDFAGRVRNRYLLTGSTRGQMHELGRWNGTTFSRSEYVADRALYRVYRIQPSVERTFDGYFYLGFPLWGGSIIMIGGNNRGHFSAILEICDIAVTDTAGRPAPAAAPAVGNADDASDDPVVTLVLSTAATEASTYAGERLVEIAYRESGGTIRMNHFPDNVLGPDRVIIESVIFGDIDIGMSATSPLVDLFPDFLMFDAHFLLRDTAHAQEIKGGFVGQTILDTTRVHGIIGKAWWDMGFRNTTSNTLIRTPADTQGLAIHTMENPIHIAAWNAFGATATSVSFAEVFRALQQGTIDGLENTLSIIHANAFQEVQDYIILTKHCYVPHLIAMNEASFNSLTPNQQRALNIAFEEATRIQWDRSEANTQRIYSDLTAFGSSLIHLTVEERAMFQQIIAESDVLDMIRAGMNNPALLDHVLAS